MSGSNIPFDGELNGLIKEYLEFFGLENACNSFVEDCKKLCIPVNECSAKSKKRESMLKLKDQLLSYFDEGDRIKFFSVWTSHINSKSISNNKTMEELEFQLQIHFAIFPFRRKNQLKNADCETAMCYFRSYLETKGTALSQNDDVLPYYALPFIPNPQIHPSFRKLFEENWVAKLRDQLEHYLFGLIENTDEVQKQPCLMKLYKQNNSKLKDMQEELNTAEIKWKESERKNSIQSKQLVKLQEDCRVLMTVLNNFIAALESAVKGDLTDLDDVLSSCMQRFPEVFNLHKISENEFNYHQSNHKILPKSVKTAKDVPIISSLDFLKIKKDILQLESKKVALLLQALRWRITKQSSVTLKTDVLMMYIEHDILNLEHTKLKENFLDKVHNSTSDILQTFLRFLNTIASFPEGRNYLARPEVVNFLLEMVSENLRAGNISYGMSAAALLKLTENCRVRKLLERADLRNMICFLSEEEFASPHNSNLLIKLFLNLFRISSVKVKYREELKKLKIIYPEEKNICDLEFKATICNLKDFLNNITEEESLSRRWENDEISENSVLEIEVDIDNDDPVVASVNGEEFLEKYYNIDFMKEREMLTDNSKNISKHLNVRLKQTGRSKSVPLMEDQGVEKSPSCHSLSGSTTPKLDPEATEMVRKIIGEHSKTLVEATAASHSSPVHIKGLNSKEYTLAFSSRPKIPRTPEPGELVVVTTQNFKIRRDSSRHTPVSPKVASSSPPNSTLQHLE